MVYAKGDKIGPYEVRFPIKEGRYAETYRVKDADGVTRFLKLINTSRLNRYQLDDAGNIIEIEVQRGLSHKNLSRMTDTGSLIVAGRRYEYFVTEFTSSETASQHMLAERFTVYQVKAIARAVLSALSYLHSQPVPIIHGEVTAQNVLLNLTGAEGDLKLIDFGRARFLNQKPCKTTFEGANIFYAAPESLAGADCTQSDLFSVGVMIYYMLWGRLPWLTELDGKTDDEKVEAMLRARERKLKIPDEELFELDDRLINTMLKAMQPDPNDRFNTAEEMIEAIDGKREVAPQPHDIASKSRVGNWERRENAPAEPNIVHGEGFAAVAGMEALKQTFREQVIDVVRNREKYEKFDPCGILGFPNGVLLYGPPGCGKTYFSNRLAEEIGFNFISKSAADLKDKYVGETEKNIARLFADAEANAPSIIFIDEINSLVPNRNNARMEVFDSQMVEEFCRQMDQTGNKGVLVMGTTNMPDQIDPAIMRAGRFDIKIYVGPPDFEARKALFEFPLRKLRNVDLGIDYDALARATEHYVSSDIAEIVKTVGRASINAGQKITTAMLLEACRNSRPSLPIAEIEKYEQLNEKITGTREPDKKPGPIGFK